MVDELSWTSASSSPYPSSWGSASSTPDASVVAHREMAQKPSLSRDWTGMGQLEARRSKGCHIHIAEAQRCVHIQSDDERTAISKKISWILRHGARESNVDIDDDGWVPFAQFRNWGSLRNLPLQKVLAVIAESNVQKNRYELKEESDAMFIRATAKASKGHEWRKQQNAGGTRTPSVVIQDYTERCRHASREDRTDEPWVQNPLKHNEVVEFPTYVPAFEANPCGQLRWRVVESKVMVREGSEVSSKPCAMLDRGALVMQIGDEKRLDNGSVRMLIESFETPPVIHGWVTRSAVDAGGPMFFKLD